MRLTDLPAGRDCSLFLKEHRMTSRSIVLSLNGSEQRIEADPQMPLLWALRENAGLTGTKFGCGIGACGACTVLVDGQPVRSCVSTTGGAEGKAVRTIEGLAGPERLHVLQQAWLDLQVPQCGYCQSGMLMAAAALLERKPAPTDADIDEAITNLCRCGTYPRIRAAIHRAAGQVAPAAGSAA
jgi:isoquinoline 1-oxidoreductase alpha subunit